MLTIKCLLPTIIAMLIVLAIVVLKNKRDDDKNSTKRDLITLDTPTRISYYELLRGTNGFDECNLIGSGSFGSVYKAVLPNEKIVAVKVFNLDMEQSSRSFDVECYAMCHLRHRNLIKSISSCSNDHFKSLIMEFMANGSLDRWLYSHNYYLNVLQRLEIYTKTLATIGYMAPEFGSKGVVSVKGDVFSYGILLMEVFTRKKPSDEMFVPGLSLKDWVSNSTPHSIMNIIDVNLLHRENQNIDNKLPYMSSIFELALHCSNELSEARLTMIDVVASLRKIKSLFTENA
ncbi:hypothetical protein K1719_040836 [Acacia pycnantha]|nr:hypothetical protein K1719_040836 [Acacia pycnantha]